MQEKFNPMDSEYKKAKDLPEDQQENFVDVDGGFIKKEAMEHQGKFERDAKLWNERRPMLERLFKDNKIDPMEFAHEEATFVDEYETKLIDAKEEAAKEKEDLLKKQIEETEKLINSLEGVEKDLKVVTAERDTLVEKLSTIREKETKIQIEKFAKKQQKSDIKDLYQRTEELDDEIVISALKEAQEIEPMIVDESRMTKHGLKTKHDKVLVNCRAQIKSLSGSIESFRDSDKEPPQELIDQLDELKQKKHSLFREVKEINKNKVVIIRFSLSFYDSSLSDKEIKWYVEQFKSLRKQGASKVLIEYKSCGGSDCDGRCMRNQWEIDERIVRPIEKEEENRKQANEEYMNIDTMYCIKKDAKKDEENYIENKRGASFYENLVDIIIEKIGGEGEDAINVLRDFLYQHSLKNQKDIARTENDFRKITSFGNIKMDLETLSSLLLEKFLDGKIGVKDLLEKFKNIDSKVSKDIFDGLREAEKKMS